ncbi:Na+-driven multidrug efflux pump [Evansella vedderi]|uniref:Na+-driven multidrug efflux pump n=1 Tax=Evansella vedderi TaxID=38282 RepID=A0ABT9ZXI1_9BACI|nr:multi antimicrobial extrusion protein MatE [Evansella vedderi]MDQ0255943.1 Na+-driven multidrug efflux pump [Evansella vedderi]
MNLHSDSKNLLSYRTVFWFFLPLGFSASLVTFSHLIINSTLARAPDPAFVIASYSIAMSLFTIFEKAAFVIRPTSAKLIRDKASYRAVSKVSIYVLLIILFLSLIIAYSFIGKWILMYIFGVNSELLTSTLDAYRILLFVTIFSGIRCLFQGIIINNLRTKWMTISMVFRLLVMAVLAYILVTQDLVHHGYIGSIIFLVGMAIEALVSTLEGLHLIKQLPEKKEDHTIQKSSHVLSFYRPLLLASFIAVLIQPSINVTLGWSEKGEVAVASYAVAWAVTQLFLSFTSYMHQIVMNFYRKDSTVVIRFAIYANMIPSLFLCLIVFTPLGTVLLQNIMGLSGELLQESLSALTFFLLFALIFPWVDFLHGMVMNRAETRIMAFSQTGNVIVTLGMLVMMFYYFSPLGGAIGSIAISIGLLAELIILTIILKYKPEKSSSKANTRRRKVEG